MLHEYTGGEAYKSEQLLSESRTASQKEIYVNVWTCAAGFPIDKTD